jgi:hypothetical protein
MGSRERLRWRPAGRSPGLVGLETVLVQAEQMDRGFESRSRNTQFVAAPDGPDTRPLVSASAASIPSSEPVAAVIADSRVRTLLASPTSHTAALQNG